MVCWGGLCYSPIPKMGGLPLKWLLFPCLGFHRAHEKDRELGTEPYCQNVTLVNMPIKVDKGLSTVFFFLT